MDIGIKASSDAPPKLTVEAVDNHIYFYADVDSDRCLDLMRNIRRADAELRNERISRSLPDDFPQTPIYLHIHSGGGNAFMGLAMIGQLQSIKTPIYSIVEGLSASAATLISMACTKRLILPNSFMLIHQLSSVHWGTHESFEDELALQNKIMDKLAGFYAQHSQLTDDQVREMLKRDTWMDENEAIEKGLADALFEG